MNREQIIEELLTLRETDTEKLEKLRDFQASVINVDKELILGIRTPDLRKLAKKMIRDKSCETFLHDLPHHYFDENQLHAFIISYEKNFNKNIALLEEFLPHIYSWATTDVLNNKIYKKNTDKLLPYIKKWISDERTYLKRTAILFLMSFYLEEHFDFNYAQMVASVKSEEYYVKMMQAWYFATALAKQWNAIIPLLTERKLPTWVHNKTIQKAIESFRITTEQKTFLRTLKIKKK